jgi:hypothetical protein
MRVAHLWSRPFTINIFDTGMKSRAKIFPARCSLLSSQRLFTLNVTRMQLHAFNDHNSLVAVPLDDAPSCAGAHPHAGGDVSLEVLGARPPMVLLR